MTQEQPWWMDDKYKKSTLITDIDDNTYSYSLPDPEKIIAEATRRGIEQGKREAWEEAKGLINEHTEFTDGGCYVNYSTIFDAIDAKLSSLSQSSNKGI